MPRLVLGMLLLAIAGTGSRTVGLGGRLGLTHLEAGARLSLPVRHPRIRPYETASVARRSLSTTIGQPETASP